MSKASAHFHDEPFDEGTHTKLELFRLYVREWLPVWAVSAQTKIKEIGIYDFFAGAGCDAVGNPGSPILICDEIQNFLNTRGSSRGIKVYLSDANGKKIEALRRLVDQKKYHGFSIEIENMDFQAAILKNRKSIASSNESSLLIIDQFGVKMVLKENFRFITHSPFVDFLMFLSSSYFTRFLEHEYTEKNFHLTPTTKQKLLSAPADLIHRTVLDGIFRLWAPDRYYLAPFSIKKGANIYGVIFGSRHPLGLQKFLESSWSIDPIFGEADFNVHNDPFHGLPLLQSEPSNKMINFENEMIAFLKNERPRSNLEILLHGLQCGFSVEKIKETLSTIHKRQGIAIDQSHGYNPQSGTFGITKNTYRGENIVFLTLLK